MFENKVIAKFGTNGYILKMDRYYTLPLLIKYHYNIFKRKIAPEA